MKIQYDKIRKFMKLRRGKMTRTEDFEHCDIHEMDYPSGIDCPECERAS